MLNIGIRQLGQLKLRRFWRRNKWSVLMLFVIIPLVTGIVYWIGFKQPIKIHGIEDIVKMSDSSAANRILGAMTEGDYSLAKDLLKKELEKNPGDASLNKMWSQLRDELKVDVKFHYLVGRKKYMTTRALTTDLTLTSKDTYYFTLTPSSNAYLYVFQADSKGRVFTLYPNKEYSPSENPLLAGMIRIPDGSMWFYLDEIKGTESIYLVASPLENKKLRDLSKGILSEKNPDKTMGLFKELIVYLKAAESATRDLPGVVVKTYQFRHG